MDIESVIKTDISVSSAPPSCGFYCTFHEL